MDDIINRLTENKQYANDICLFLLINDGYTQLKYLDEIGIRGKKLEIFIEKCCGGYDYENISNILLLISWEVFEIELVKRNIDSKHPILLIQEHKRDNEHWMDTCKRLKKTFIENMNGKSR